MGLMMKNNCRRDSRLTTCKGLYRQKVKSCSESHVVVHMVIFDAPYLFSFNAILIGCFLNNH